ncbi:MAG: tRNA lysidine(34) synthetase TilS [Gammaproteobacteria bacterium]|nr:tRNA lysidine(34) synthetase TilS [Gammaproteobacteria bacterium]
MRKSDPAFSATALAELIFGEWQLTQPAHIKVAFSGGLDSHTLLDALVQMRATHEIVLTAWHVEHGLQPAAASWAGHCARVCRAYDVPLVCSPVQVDSIAEDGLEAAARRARYAAFRRGVLPGEILLLAHQRDDQAETMLLQLLRGTGLTGLAAMPERVPFGEGEMWRPLLRFARASLFDYAKSRGLQWIEDPSNLDTRLRRNFLRREIMPRLHELWPAASALLARTARHVAEAEQLLNELAQADLAGCVYTDDRQLPVVRISALEGISPARQRNVLRYWLRQQGFLAPSVSHLDTLMSQLWSGTRPQRFRVTWPGVEIWRYRDALAALQAIPIPGAALSLPWKTSSPLVAPGIGRLSGTVVRGAGIAMSRFGDTLNVQLRRGGETLQLPGRMHHHALKKLLQDKGVPPWLRSRLPMLYAGNDLIAVADLWIDSDHVAKPDENGFVPVWEPFPYRSGSLTEAGKSC